MLGIVCQICSKRPATTHLTELDPGDGQRRELHLCATCIEQLELQLESGPPPIAEILKKKPQPAKPAGTAAIEMALAEEAATEAPGEQCTACGLTFAEFAVNNRFGCAACYTDFTAKVETLLARYHGSSLHAGRLPASLPRTADDLGLRRAKLDAALREAVSNEAYEKAARLRDEIRKLDEQG